jgi:hypothetical protein
MKTWLTKFRISAAQDSGHLLPPSVHRAIDRSPDLREFAQAAAALDEALKQTKPTVEPPPSLHSDIMRAIRAKRPAVERQRPLHWAWAPATAVLLLLCLWQFRRPTPAPDSQPWSAPLAITMETGQRFATTMPATAASPLTDEWQRLNQDLTHATDFLLASLP